MKTGIESGPKIFSSPGENQKGTCLSQLVGTTSGTSFDVHGPAQKTTRSAVNEPDPVDTSIPSGVPLHPFTIREKLNSQPSSLAASTNALTPSSAERTPASSSLIAHVPSSREKAGYSSLTSAGVITLCRMACSLALRSTPLTSSPSGSPIIRPPVTLSSDLPVLDSSSRHDLYALLSSGT